MYPPLYSRYSALQSGDLDRIRYKGKQRDIKMQHSQLHRRICYCRGMDSRRWRSLSTDGSYGRTGYNTNLIGRFLIILSIPLKICIWIRMFIVYSNRKVYL